MVGESIQEVQHSTDKRSLERQNLEGKMLQGMEESCLKPKT